MDVWGGRERRLWSLPIPTVARSPTPCVTLGSDFICLGLSFLSQRRRIIIASTLQGCLSISES